MRRPDAIRRWSPWRRAARRAARDRLRIAVDPRDRLVLTLAGPLDATTRHNLQAVLAEHWTPQRPLVVDLSDVTAIDAAGRAALTAIDDRCRLASATFVR